MLNLPTILRAVNTWIVAAAAVLAIVVDELAPLAELHPGVEWAVRVAGAAIVVLATASRILARSTEVPPALRGLEPDVDHAASWTAWNGGTFVYTPRARARRRGGIVTPTPPPDTAA